MTAAYLLGELEHLLEVADQQPMATRAAFMTSYLEGLLIPVNELAEAFNPDHDALPCCSACGGGSLAGNTCARCGLCLACDELADDCNCPIPAEVRFSEAMRASL